jgi:fatty acid/phospholipid biosynthesis enzyme
MAHRVGCDGGDRAPGPIVTGAIQAVVNDSELQLLLVGDRAQIEPLLPSRPGTATT